MQALNSVKDKKERIGRMLLMHANNREDVKEAATAGDIVAACWFKRHQQQVILFVILR